MKLAYTDEIIASPEGVSCAVLDTSQLDYSAARLGRKSAMTLVRQANGGEIIATKNADGLTESTYMTKQGDVIFINLHNPADAYVPAKKDGTRWAFSELEQRGYETVEQRSADPLEVVVKSTKVYRILPEIVTKPTCIKDVWGLGAHQFLYEGATLKLDESGRTTGIDRDAFNNTWEFL